MEVVGKMKMNNYMDQFIFTDRLRDQLQGLKTNPEMIQLTPVLCFHGFAGVGKTSFGKLLCDDLCADVKHFAMNERSLKNSFIEGQIKPLFRTRSLLDTGDKCFSRGIILDEFHNLTPKDQDRFKVVFDDLTDALVIICLNTMNTKPLHKCLTEPIYSRVHPINFNIRDEENELTEMISKVNEKYPLLSRTKVYSWLPDMRVITREGKLSVLRSAAVGGAI